MKIKQCNLLFLIVVIFLSGCANPSRNQDILTIVPYPKDISSTGQSITYDIKDLGINPDARIPSLGKIIKDDLYRLSGIMANDKQPLINLSIESNLEKEEYAIRTGKNNIEITGGSYEAVSMGWVSLLQMADIKDGKFTIQQTEIKDRPDLSYRGLMLDLARQFHTTHVVKQVIDICRWYKIPYLHLHLSDEGSFVFPTKKFPKVVRGKRYTAEEMQEMIEYAHERGVTLIPEIEGPGHSSALRVGYPELFGEPELDVLDLSKDITLSSMKELISEVMEVFHYSPYFHMGADEINLNILKEKEHVKKKIKEKGYSDVHDLYLNYVSEIHQFIRSKGKQTLVWEGFDKDGSEHVKIPKDINVCVFETLFQTPDSLANNGYHLLNTTWKPLYITQTRRWSPEKIYSWNYYTWENFWEKTPAAKAPIVLDEDQRKYVFGAQLCAWEMPEEMEYPELSKRLAALSERVWNTSYIHTYEQFESRMINCEAKLRNLLYPLEIKADGLTMTDYDGVYYNRQNYFSENLNLSIKSGLPGTTLYYTTDRTFPTTQSNPIPENITLNTTTFLKMALYNADGELISYYPVLYENRPLKVEFIGENFNDNNPDYCITFDNEIKVKITQLPAKGSVHYTLDGSDPLITSPQYAEEIPISAISSIRFQYFDENGEAKGERYGYFLCPQKEWYELLRFNYRW